MKFGSYAEILSLLKLDMSHGGRRVHVVMNGLPFYPLLLELAADISCGYGTFWRMNNSLIRKGESFKVHRLIAKKMTELRGLILESTEFEACLHQSTSYVIRRDVQLAIDEFGEMANECNNDMVRAVDMFNECFQSVRYFQHSSDRAPFRNVYYIEHAIANPICVIGSLSARNGPSNSFLSLVLQYLATGGNEMQKQTFLRAAGDVDDPRFEPTYELIYRAYHKYYCLGYQVCQLES